MGLVRVLDLFDGRVQSGGGERVVGTKELQIGLQGYQLSVELAVQVRPQLRCGAVDPEGPPPTGSAAERSLDDGLLRAPDRHLQQSRSGVVPCTALQVKNLGARPVGGGRPPGAA